MRVDITRKEFLQWTALTGATVALAGCATPPHQALVSQLELPEYRLPGEAKWFATTCQECAGGCGIGVRLIDGRAKKLEGISEHPINHGKVCARGHSSLQALYHPERLSSILKRNGNQFTESSDWNEGVKVLAGQLSEAAQNKGSMLWITEPVYGTLGALMMKTAQNVGAKLWILDFPGTTAQRTAMKGLTGKPELPYYKIRNADYIVNFGNDFLLNGNLPVHDAWQYGEFRQGKGRDLRGILVSFSPRMNLSDSNSDKWIPTRPGTEGWVAMGLGNVIARDKKKGWPSWASQVSLEKISKITGVSVDVFERLGGRLLKAKQPLAIAGTENGVYSNGSWTVWMVQMLNRLLGAKLDAVETDLLTPFSGLKGIAPHQLVSTQEAMAQLKAGKFKTAWVFGVNPRFLLPSKLNFEQAFSNIKNKVVFSLFRTETTLLADWVLPVQTWYESWGDRLVRAPFGLSKNGSTVYNVQQPVVQGRSGSQSTGDLLLSALHHAGESVSQGLSAANFHDLLRAHEKDNGEWETMVARGGAWESYPLDWELYEGKEIHPLYPPPPVQGKAKPPSGINPWTGLKKSNFSAPQEPKLTGKGQVLIPFYSPALGDGSLANRPWMQELSDPLTTVVWTHWIELPVSFAKKLGVERGDVVRITSGSGSITGPAYPNLALHEEAVAVPVGQGHFHYGSYANRGANPLSILDPVWQKETGELAWVGTRVQVEKVGGKARMTVLDERMDNFPKEFMPL